MPDPAGYTPVGLLLILAASEASYVRRYEPTVVSSTNSEVADSKVLRCFYSGADSMTILLMVQKLALQSTVRIQLMNK